MTNEEQIAEEERESRTVSATEIMVRDSEAEMVDLSERYQPRTLEGLKMLAHWLSESRLAPKDISQHPQSVLQVLMTGAELGLSPLQSLHNLHPIKGRISMSAEMMRSRVMSHPDCEYFLITESEKDHATIRLRRRSWPEGHEATVTWTMEDAKQAGLVKSDSNYQKFPRNMMVARATTFAVSQHFPEVRAGLMATEEALDLPSEKNVTPKPSHQDKLREKLIPKKKPAAPKKKVQKVEESQQMDPPEKVEVSYILKEEKQRLEKQAEQSGLDLETWENLLKNRFDTTDLLEVPRSEIPSVIELIDEAGGDD